MVIDATQLVHVILTNAPSLVVMQIVCQILIKTPVFVRLDIPTLITGAHLTVGPFHIQVDQLTVHNKVVQDAWPLLTQPEPALHAHVLLDTLLLLPRPVSHARTTPIKLQLVQRNVLNARAVSLQLLLTAL